MDFYAIFRRQGSEGGRDFEPYGVPELGIQVRKHGVWDFSILFWNLISVLVFVFLSWILLIPYSSVGVHGFSCYIQKRKIGRRERFWTLQSYWAWNSGKELWGFKASHFFYLQFSVFLFKCWNWNRELLSWNLWLVLWFEVVAVRF